MKTTALSIVCTFAFTLASSQATNYTFNGTTATSNWGTNSTWSNQGIPGASDTINLVNSASSSILGVNAVDRSVASMNDAGITGSFSVLASGGNYSLSIGSLTKSSASALTFRSSSANVLSVDITSIDQTGSALLNFGSSAANSVGSVSIGSLSMNMTVSASGIIFYGADGGTATIGSANITEGRLSIRNIAGGSATLEIGSLTGSGGSIRGTNSQVTTGNLKLTKASGSVSYAGTLVDGAVGATLNVEKTNAGTQGLTGVSTYTGATVVTAGTLLVSGGGSINSTTGITVAAGATFNHSSSVTNSRAITLNGSGAGSKSILAGNGTFSAALTLDNLGDTLAPGNSPGIQTFTSNQTWTSFSYDWELQNFAGSTAGTDFDQVAITGGLTLDGSAYRLNVASLTLGGASGPVGNFSETDRSWTILTTTTGIAGFDAGEWTLNLAGFSSSPTYAGGFSLGVVGNNLVLTYAVPEPSTWILLAAGLTVVITFRQRRKA